MNNQTIHELSEAISLNPEDAKAILKKGGGLPTKR